MDDVETLLRSRHLFGARPPRRLRQAIENVRAIAAEARRQGVIFGQIDDLLSHASAETVAEARRLAAQFRSPKKADAKLDPGFETETDGPERLLPSMLQARRYGLANWLYRTLLAVESGRSGDILLINDTRSQNNIGCRTTTNALIDGLESRGRTVWHSVMLAELATIRRNTGIDSAIPPSPEEAADRFMAAETLEPYRALISRSRLVLVNAEGSFYDRQVKGLAACVIAIAARRMGAKIVIGNHSAELHDPVMRAYVQAAYAAADLVWLREAVSAASVRHEIPVDRLDSSADAAFLHALLPITPLPLPARLPRTFPDDTLDLDIGARPVIVGGSSVLLRADRDPVDVRAIGRLCERILASGRAVCLYSADEADNRVLRPVAMRLGLPLLPAHWGIEQVGPIIAAGSAMISGRWHGSILAACFGTPPILGDANFFKTRALHEILQLNLPQFDYATLDASSGDIIAALDRIDAEGPRLRSKVRRVAVAQARLAQASLNRIAAMLA